MTTAASALPPPLPFLLDGGEQCSGGSGSGSGNRSSSRSSGRSQPPPASYASLSQLESSGNPHNRRFVALSSATADSRDNTNSSNATAGGGSTAAWALACAAAPSAANSLLLAPPSLLPPPRASGASPPLLLPPSSAAAAAASHIPPPAASATSSAPASAPPKDGDKDVWIEERRRRLDAGAGGPSDASPGYTVHHYIRGRLLGKGGFAKVYLCTAVDTGKHYAVKVVPKANLVKARARQKLQAEIKIHRTLKHRHVCEFKHFFEDKENCYILLELCHNQSMNEMIKRRKRLTEPEAAYYMTQLLEAVQYLHDRNVIHRDLKLGNLFLDRQLHIKVGDLGLATRVDDRDEKRKTICGTPNYIAPEIIQNDKAKRGHSFEVDVWSMGVILYTVLVGKPPYEAKNVKATYQRILKNEYSFPPHVKVSSTAKDLVVRMLQTEPSDRPSLQEIGAHPFLASKYVPDGLPPSVLHFAPQWTYAGDRVELVAGGDNTLPGSGSHHSSSSSSGSSAPRKPALPRPSSTTSGGPRQPFGYRDVNSAQRGPLSTANDTKAPPPSSATSSTAPSATVKPVIDMERVVRSALALSGVAAAATTTTTTTTTTTPSSSAAPPKAAPPPSSSKPRAVNALAALAASSKSVYSCGFKIFDEAAPSESPSSAAEHRFQAKPPPSQSQSSRSTSTSASSSEESTLVRKTKALALSSASTPASASSRGSSHSQSQVPRHHHSQAPQMQTTAFASFASSTTSSHAAATDTEILHNMVNRLEAVLEVTASRRGAYRLQLPRSVPAAHGPSKWVCRYVDYTTKYGLGFLLNDGSSGVYFNDSTKAVMERDGELFQYTERKKVESDPSTPTSSLPATTETFTLSSHPESLKKKVTLLKHFRNYLLEQNRDSGDALKSPRNDGSGSPSSPTLGPSSSANLVYVKKWVRTKHSILFRLSDQTVQVVFFDQSELLLTPDDRYITYVDKSRKRLTFPFTDELVGSSPELETRLKYAREILSTFLARPR